MLEDKGISLEGKRCLITGSDSVSTVQYVHLIYLMLFIFFYRYPIALFSFPLLSDPLHSLLLIPSLFISILPSLVLFFLYFYLPTNLLLPSLLPTYVPFFFTSLTFFFSLLFSLLSFLTSFLFSLLVDVYSRSRKAM